MREKRLILTNEEGSVLAFSVVMLTVMIFLVTAISMTTVDRIAVARRVSDNSRETSEAEEVNANLDKAIEAVVVQTDELTRYYLRQRYYQKNDTVDFNSGVNADFDEVLAKLVDGSFQHDVYAVYGSGGGDLSKLADLLFAHLLSYRTETTATPIGTKNLDSILSRTRELIEATELYTDSPVDPTTGSYLDISADPGFSSSRESFSALEGKRNSNESYLKVTMQTAYILPISGSRLKTDVEVEFLFPQYSYSGSDVTSPIDTEALLDNVVHYTRNVIVFE